MFGLLLNSRDHNNEYCIPICACCMGIRQARNHNLTEHRIEMDWIIGPELEWSIPLKSWPYLFCSDNADTYKKAFSDLDTILIM